jgi:hypothetical protein
MYGDLRGRTLRIYQVGGKSDILAQSRNRAEQHKVSEFRLNRSRSGCPVLVRSQATQDQHEGPSGSGGRNRKRSTDHEVAKILIFASQSEEYELRMYCSAPMQH